MESVDAVAAAAAAAVMMQDCAAPGDATAGLGEVAGERRERVLLRPWLENLIDSGLVAGLEWIDTNKTMFKVPWKHRSKKNWSLRHSSIFLVRRSMLFITPSFYLSQNCSLKPTHI